MNKRLIYRATFGLCILTAVLAVTLSTQAVGDGYIKGVVTDRGRPARAIWITVVQNGGEKGSSPAGDDGRYYVGGLDNGDYQIIVTRGDQRLCQKQIRLPDNNGTYNIDLPCY